MSINIYNESQLHKTLKILYAENFNGETEVEKNGYIYDIVTKDNQIIEIQTKNLSKLLPKLLDTIKESKVTLVHPIIINTKISLYDKDNNLLHTRKSPKKGCIFDVFRELTGIYPILLNENFNLELLEVQINEIRVKTEETALPKNKRGRYKKDWYKKDKKLEEIFSTIRLSTSEDYINLLPENLPEIFCAKDIKTAMKNSKKYPSSAQKQAHLIIWVLSRMELIELVEIKNHGTHYYKLSDKLSDNLS